MKRSIKFLIIIAIVVVVAACMEIISINHPTSAPVSSEVNASIKVKVTVAQFIGVRTTFLFGFLAPESWNIEENATITYSSDNMPGEGAVSNLKMRVATSSDLFGGKEWKTIMTEKLGFRKNYEPVKWVAFIAEKNHEWKDNDTFEGTIHIKFKTGSENIRTNLSYFIGNTQDGVHDDTDFYLLRDQLFMTTGGSNSLIDYTLPKMCYVDPKEYTWEDIVRFNFNATIKVDGADSPLKDAEEVYLLPRAIYNNGASSVAIDEISDKTLMKANGKNKWFLYMYPHEYFSIPLGTKIEKIELYLVNKDKSITVKLPDGDNFSFSENCP